MDIKKKRAMAKAIAAFLIISILFTCMVQTFAATENDLRCVMGLERLDTSAYRDQASAILARAVSYEEFQAMVQDLEAEARKRGEKLAALIHDMEAAYGELEAVFTSGGEASEVVEALKLYDLKQASVYAMQEDISSGEKEKIALDDMAEAVERASEIIRLCSTTEDLGDVGDAADTFLCNALNLIDVTDEGITCRVSKGDGIYSQFNGIVQAITQDAVCVGSGETVLIAYRGIKAEPGMKIGDPVQQYQKIGDASDTKVTVNMVICGEKENILKMYGSRAKRWQDAWRNVVPWGDSGVDLSKVLGTSNWDKEAGDSKTFMVTADGETLDATISDVPRAGKDLILDKNPFKFME